MLEEKNRIQIYSNKLEELLGKELDEIQQG